MTTTATTEEKTADKTEQKDRDLPLPQLVEKVGAGVLGNPFLSAFISAAPSPKAADEEMIHLGWPNELARRVRLGVYLYRRCRQLGENVWSEMTKVTTRISEQMFDFGYKPDGLQFESKVNVSWSSAFKLDTFRVDCPRPLFLREVRMDTLEWKEENYRTSVDDIGLGEHNWQNGFDVVHDLFDSEEHNLNHFGDIGRGFIASTTPERSLCVSSANGGKSAFFTTQDGERRNVIFLRTKNVLLGTKPDRLFPRNFPSLYKVLEVTRDDTVDERRISERIRVLIRQDQGEGITNNRLYFWDEWVTYVREAAISDKVNVVLRVKYRITPKTDRLVRCDSGAEPIGVRLKHEGIRTEERHLTDVRIGQTIQEFSGLAAKLYQGSSLEVKLERIAGISLATNPPKELVELFVSEPRTVTT